MSKIAAPIWIGLSKVTFIGVVYTKTSVGETTLYPL